MMGKIEIRLVGWGDIRKTYSCSCGKGALETWEPARAKLLGRYVCQVESRWVDCLLSFI